MSEQSEHSGHRVARPAVRRRVFRDDEGHVATQWGIRDRYGTWHGHPDQAAAFAAAFGITTAA